MSASAPPCTKLPTLRVVVIHEDDDAGEQAGTILRVVETMFREVANLCMKRWSFHHLERLDVRAMAGRHGKDATILMVCSSSENSLPESVCTWMQRTYQAPHCRKPLIIRHQHGSVAKEDFAHRLASAWRVPLVRDFSLDSPSCWESLRDFVEQRLSSMRQEIVGETPDPGEKNRSPSAGSHADEPVLTDPAIRDRAYQLWLSAGRPVGRTTEFWLEAEREIQAARNASDPTRDTIKVSPSTQTHEDPHAHSGLRRQPAPEFMLRIPHHLHARQADALLQHLARIPQELLTKNFRSRRDQASPPARQTPAGMTQGRRTLSAPADLPPHTPLTPMIIRLDWFGCEPTAAKEQHIHQTLETLQGIKPISRASVRVEEQANDSPAYHLTLMLAVPGPDVLAHGVGHTFDEALKKLKAAALKALENRARKSRQLNGAVRGVKASHRG
jgi:hypothetical protein